MAGIKKRKLEIWTRPDGKIPAAAYLRVSSLGQDIENSIESQLERIQKWANENGYVIVRVFTDEAKTGRFANRPDFQEMIEVGETDNCPFEAVLVWRFSRFYRNSLESGWYKKKLRNKGIRVISISEPTDDTPQGQLQEGVIELFDQYQSDTISIEVQKGLKRLAEQGFYTAPRPPTGMTKVREPVIDHKGRETGHFRLAPGQDSWKIRRIFDLALQEKTDRQIQLILRGEGILNPNGKPFPANRISDILNNRHYEGTILWGQLPDGSWEVVTEKAHKGIVSPDEFKKVRELRQERAPEVAHPRHAGSEHMLSELGKCRQCGASYVYRPSGSKGNTYEYIKCQTRKELGPEFCDSPILPASAFEAMTLDVIEEDILLRQNLEAAIDELRKNSGTLHSEKAKEVAKIRENVADLDRRFERAYVAWEGEKISDEYYNRRSKELGGLKAQATAELAKAEESLDDTHTVLNNPEEVLDYSAEVKAFLRDESPARTRRWLKKFLLRYWVEPGYVTYQYHFPLPSGSAKARQRKSRVPLDEELRPTARLSPPTRRSNTIRAQSQISQDKGRPMTATWQLGKTSDGAPYHLPDHAIDQGLLVCSNNPDLRQATLAQALRCRLNAQEGQAHPKQVHVLAQQPTDSRAVPVDPIQYAQGAKSLPSLAIRSTTLFLPDMAAAADPHWSFITHMVVTGNLALATAAAPEYLCNLATEHPNIWSAFGTVIITTLSPAAEETLQALFGPVADGAMSLSPGHCRIRPGWHQTPFTLTLNPILADPATP